MWRDQSCAATSTPLVAMVQPIWFRSITRCAVDCSDGTHHRCKFFFLSFCSTHEHSYIYVRILACSYEYTYASYLIWVPVKGHWDCEVTHVRFTINKCTCKQMYWVDDSTHLGLGGLLLLLSYAIWCVPWAMVIGKTLKLYNVVSSARWIDCTSCVLVAW